MKKIQGYQPVLAQLPLVRESLNVRIRTPEDVKRECCDMLALAQESFQIVTLNAKNLMINRTMITLGLLDSSLVHPREVFRAAVLDSAAAIILIHNHPSGDPTPSAEDIRITRQLVEAGKIMDIKIIDHVVLTKDRIVSMKEQGLVDFA